MVKPLSTSDVFLDEESAKKKAKNNQDPNSSKGRSNEIDMSK